MRQRNAKEDLDPLQTVYYTLNYARAKELEGKIKPLMSKAAQKLHWSLMSEVIRSWCANIQNR